MRKSDVQVSTRSVMGRRGKVYDARGSFEGVEYNVQGARTRLDAIERAIAEVTYIQAAGEKSAHGFRLFAHGNREWVLQFPHGGSYCFGAENLGEASTRLAREYHDHAEIQAFLAA